MNRYFLISALFLASLMSFSQDGSDLFSMLEEPAETPSLLPDRMLVTQRLLWGEKGILRTSGIAPLTLEQRQKELKLRRTMLTAHQVLGYTTLAAMIAQGIIGGKLYTGQNDLYELHKDMAAGLSLFTPPPLINKKVKGFTSIKAHKTLATIHFSAMVVTNIYKDKNKEVHKGAAYTAFGSYALAVLVFKF